jgi:hypothetical protein
MITGRNVTVSVFCALLWTPLMYAQDLSRYRKFQFGMNLPAVAKKADVKLSEARVVRQGPATIQELEWWPQHSPTASPQADSVKEALFSFYSGELFLIVVHYDPYWTQGLTSNDMVEAISATYGTPTRPAARIISFPSSQGYNDSEKVMACWEDSQYSFNLFRSSYQPTFGMVMFSKRLDALARLAGGETIRLDEREAPQGEIERQRKEDQANRAAQEKARPANKAKFRP